MIPLRFFTSEHRKVDLRFQRNLSRGSTNGSSFLLSDQPSAKTVKLVPEETPNRVQ